MTFKKSLLLIFVLTLFLAACQPETTTFQRSMPAAPAIFDSDNSAAEEAPAAGFVMDESEALSFSDANKSMPNQPAPAEAQQRLIIRTADMSIVVTDTEEAMATISKMVEENGGWIVSSNVFQYDQNAMTGSMTVRVPAEGFQSALDAIRLLSVEVNSVSTSGQDVTEEFVDLSARLENLESTADRVRSFLDETKNVEEAWTVNQELGRLEGEIESFKGRIQYLSQSAAFSTISINLTPDILSQPIEVGGWRPTGVAKDAVETLIVFLQALADFLIRFAIVILPIGLILGVPIWLVIRTILRRRRSRSVVNSE